MTTTKVSNGEDILDSRDIIARIEELTDERSERAERDDAAESLPEWDEENAAELAALKTLQDEAEGYSEDWRHGATLIRDTYFEDYAQELAEDIGAIDKAASWPHTCIDWKRAAELLKQDYTMVDFDGVDYWVR